MKRRSDICSIRESFSRVFVDGQSKVHRSRNRLCIYHTSLRASRLSSYPSALRYSRYTRCVRPLRCIFFVLSFPHALLGLISCYCLAFPLAKSNRALIFQRQCSDCKLEHFRRAFPPCERSASPKSRNSSRTDCMARPTNVRSLCVDRNHSCLRIFSNTFHTLLDHTSLRYSVASLCT